MKALLASLLLTCALVAQGAQADERCWVVAIDMKTEHFEVIAQDLTPKEARVVTRILGTKDRTPLDNLMDSLVGKAPLGDIRYHELRCLPMT